MPHNFESLESVLDHPEMRGAFRKFLSTEYSSENLQFLETVDAFKAACQDPNVSDQQLRQRANQISNLFVQQGSHDQVNISSDSYNGIQASLGNLGTMSRAQMSTMFDTGLGDVTALMRRDTFPRFLRSDLAENTVKNLDDIERLEAQLEKLKTSNSEKAKAFFKGGAEKEKRKLQGEIDALQTSIDQSILAQPYVLPALPVPAQALPGPQMPPPAPVVVVAQLPPPQQDALQVEEMSMEEFNAMDQGQMGRPRGVDPGARVRDQDGPEEDEQQGLEIEEMSMEELAGMQQGRSRAVNSNVKPGGNAPPPQELGNGEPSTRKSTSVRESLGKKPEDSTTVNPGQRTRL